MFYPNIEISLEELIKLIINREYNAINRWTKTSIIQYIGAKKISEEFNMELIANLFNPDQLLSEVSAWAMYHLDQRFYEENIKRLDMDQRNHIQNLMLGQKFGNTSELRPHLKFEIVNFLKKKSLLAELPSYILTSIVDFIHEIYIENKTIISSAEWHNESFYIIKHGGLEIKGNQGELMAHFGEGDFLGEQVNIDLLDDHISFGVVADTVLLQIDKNKFLDLITNEYEVTLKLLDSFSIQGEITELSEN